MCIAIGCSLVTDVIPFAIGCYLFWDFHLRKAALTVIGVFHLWQMWLHHVVCTCLWKVKILQIHKQVRPLLKCAKGISFSQLLKIETLYIEALFTHNICVFIVHSNKWCSHITCALTWSRCEFYVDEFYKMPTRIKDDTLLLFSCTLLLGSGSFHISHVIFIITGGYFFGRLPSRLFTVHLFDFVSFFLTSRFNCLEVFFTWWWNLQNNLKSNIIIYYCYSSLNWSMQCCCSRYSGGF